mmetsp:Transcript_57668/g.93330  ORF Transcript_57668/g.93330 Transcript_57668/m.93330 type:complete len:88 (+) Transcript_57668:2-265(+)
MSDFKFMSDFMSDLLMSISCPISCPIFRSSFVLVYVVFMICVPVPVLTKENCRVLFGKEKKRSCPVGIYIYITDSRKSECQNLFEGK